MAGIGTLARPSPRTLVSGALGSSALSALLLLLIKAGRARRCLTGLSILGIRSTTLVALFICARNFARFLRTKHQYSLRSMAWFGVSAWAASEAVFLVYILEYKRRLDSQTSRRWQAVTAHSTEEKRYKSMERYLLSLTQVSQCNVATGSQEPKRRNALDDEMNNLGRSLGPTAYKAAPLKKFASADKDAWSVSKVRSFPSSGSLFSHKHDESVADLLKLWEGNENVTDDELQRLKWVELASFFDGPGRGDTDEVERWMQRGNVEDWVAHYWFRGAHPEDFENRPREKQELSRLVDMVLDSSGLMHIRSGRNMNIRCFRTFSDPLPVVHRPLIIYGVTSLLCPLLTRQVMTLMGFHRERVGGLSYWKRDHRKMDPELDITGNKPLVFAHGLGVGLVPYYVMIGRLSARHSGDFYVPEFPFLAMAPWESVPSAREVVAQLQDMLAANGHSAAHFVGHSFGCIVTGWMMKMSPGSVVCTTLMEPAQFLMMKSECLAKVLYGTPKTCYEMAIRYFGFRELFTVNLLCRNFFWEQSTMWPEEIMVPALIELGSADHIVQSLFVRRLLEHERSARKERRKKKRGAMPITSSSVDVRSDSTAWRTDAEVLEIFWCEGFLHGEILLRPRSQDKLFAKMRQMRLQTEGAR